jgi:hypothetical protein
MGKTIQQLTDKLVRRGIRIDPYCKTSQYLLALFDIYEGKEPNITDDDVLSALREVKDELLQKALKDKEKSEGRKKANIIRWERERQKTKARETYDNVQYAEVVEQYPFETFWNTYDKMRNRGDCEFVWQRLSDTDKANIMQHVTKYIASTPNKKYRKDPITYLKKRSWEDEIITDTTPQNNGNNNKQYNNRLAQQQQNNEVLCNIMAEAAAAVQPYNPIETTGAGNL